MKKFTSMFLIACIFAMSCGGSKENSASTNSLYSKNFVYVDGNGNRYMINASAFEYFPTTPGVSSSGSYSGGTAVKNTPTTENFHKLADLIQAASEAKGEQTEKPEMGTGRIEIKDGTVSNSFILRMGSSWISQIETLLNDMKKA